MKRERNMGISFFQRYLTLWVIICMVLGILIGKYLPGIPEFLNQFEYAKVSIPMAILIWLMIYPMMMKVDFQSIKNVGKNPKGLFVTWITNWLMKPFTMYGIASLFFFVIFKAFITPKLARSYLAGAVLLGAAPCTAMVGGFSKVCPPLNKNCHANERLHGFMEIIYQILSLGENTRVVMEATGRYHEPVAMELHDRGIFVSVVNPLVIHGYCSGGTVRKVKNDQKDSLKIAKFALDHWVDLREYTPMDAVRQQLKIFSRQYNLYMKSRVALQSNLIALTDKVFPGVNEIFTSPERSDGHLKWVDFVTTFWHCECISLVSENAFTERYKKWCKRMGYKFSAAKASDIYIDSLGHIVTLPKNNNTKLLIQTAAKELTAMNELLAVVKAEMVRLAKELPEYETVHAMFGVGDVTAAQLMAEIGDIRNYPRRSSLVGFAGVDPEVNQSGKMNSESNPSTKRGSPHLRKTLFQLMTVYLRLSPADEAVYQFLDKKRAEGKPYYVYMTAGANKFLRIYYARVKECMAKLETPAETAEENG